MRRRRVLIVGDRRRARVAALAQTLQESLAQLGTTSDVDLDHAIDLSRVRADLVLVLGGDGSILHAARRLGRNRIPVMGVNLGNLGFLATVSAKESPARIAEDASGELRIEERCQIAVEVVGKRGRVARVGNALNDAVVDRGSGVRLLTLGVHVDGSMAFETRGDGLVVSTPTGSTAYSLAAGGPILHPSLGVLLLTPICPHSLTNRPVVVPMSTPIEIEVLDSDGAARLSLDGLDVRPGGVEKGETIRIRRSRSTVRLAVRPADRFYGRLRNKLHFAR